MLRVALQLAMSAQQPPLPRLPLRRAALPLCANRSCCCRPPLPQDEQSSLQRLNDRLAHLRLRKGDLEKRIRELGRWGGSAGFLGRTPWLV